MIYAIFNRTLTKIRLRIYKWIIFVTVNFTKFSKLFKFVILSFILQTSQAMTTQNQAGIYGA